MIERTVRVAGPAAVALFVAVGVALSPHPVSRTLLAGVVAVVVSVALAVRQVTGWPVVAGLVVAGAAIHVVCDADPGNLGWFAICVLAAWAALTSDVVPTAVFGLVALAGFAGQWIADPAEAGWGAWPAGTLFTLVACLMARRQRQLLDQLQEAQAGLAERAASEERNRIAHELHDVIGHALTVSLLHVTSARLALAEDPVEAAASLAEAERLAQQSLAEVRVVVGLMQETGSASPLPGADDLETLVGSFVSAGTDVRWSVDGDVASLTAAEGLTVYRILQEALTNVARHAPGSPVVARLELGDGGTRVVVDSGGAPAADVSGGTGLTGMRQRAHALGGTLTAGPHERGWRVEAVLPS